MKRVLCVIAATLLLTACASNNADYYSSVQEANRYQYEIQKAKYEAETARYNAMSLLAVDGDQTTRVAVAMGLAMNNSGQSNTDSRPVVAAPPEDRALKWAQVLAGPLTQLGVGYFNKEIQINNSNNNRDVQLGTIGAVAGMGTSMGQQIQDGSTYGYDYINPTPVIAPDPVIVQPPETVVVEQPAPIIVSPEIVSPEIVEPIVIQ